MRNVILYEQQLKRRLIVKRRLRRISEEEWIGGVCAGIGYRLGIPTWIVRLIWTCAFLLCGIGLILYILLWIFMPVWEETPEDYYEISG